MSSRRASRDIGVQRRHDEKRLIGWPCYEARLEAVTEARLAVRRGEAGSRFALRQALVDLASVCEELASPMHAPDEKLIAA